MPPQSVITSSLGEVKKKLSALESRCSQLEGRVHLIELPGDTVAQEVERLRENAERTLVEMRQMRESIFAWGRTTKKNCKVYADAMQTYFQLAEKSIISHKEENKRQREILKRFVFDTEKQMVKARDIRDIIDPLKKDVEALKQTKDRAPLALQDEVNVDTLIAPLTDWTLTEVEERSLGDIPEFPEVHNTTSLQEKFDDLQHRLLAFEQTVFAGSDASPAINPIGVIKGRLAVSQQEAANARSRSASREDQRRGTHNSHRGLSV
jgi:hypothetical protein